MNKKLRIAFITNNYTPYSGGVVSSINTTAQGLRTRGHKVNIITLDFLHARHYNEPDIIRLYCPLKFLYKKNHMAVPWRATKQLMTIIDQIKPDVIHSHHPFLLGTSAICIARKLHIPIIFTHHTQYHAYAHYVPAPQFLTQWLIAKLVKQYCNNVDRIIAPGTTIKQYLEQQQINKPITVLPSSVDSFYFQPTCNKKRVEKFRLLTVSRFTKEKNIYFLLDVFSALDQEKCTFWLLGYGAEKKALCDYAYKKLGLSQNAIQFIECPSKDVIKHYYQHSDVFIFASQTETQGIVLAEAMACATPVIALKAPGAQDIVDSGINGFLVENKNEMIAIINHLINNPLHLEQLQKNALQKSHQYHPDIISQQFEQLLLHVVGII